jgi:hypothetical protein
MGCDPGYFTADFGGANNTDCEACPPGSGLPHIARNVTSYRSHSVSGLVSKLWYRCPFDQSEQSKWKIRLRRQV